MTTSFLALIISAVILGVICALGLRTSFLIGVCTVLLAGVVGFLFGAVPGFVGGRIDSVFSRIMDFFSAFPGLLLIIALMTVLGSSVRNVVIVLVVATWESFGRVTRAAALTLREQPFIEAARVSGVSLPRMVATHIRLHIFPVIASLCVIELPRVVLAEATLSFLGFGLDSSTFSLGTIIADERDYLQIHPWAVALPGLTLASLCVGLALLGLGFRRPALSASEVRDLS